MSDIDISRKQYIKAKTAEVRLRHTLAADAECARNRARWVAEHDALFGDGSIRVYDAQDAADDAVFDTPLRRLGEGK